ncbi:phospholipid phosphatase-related protein type 1-like isoform X2 [Limulus polyphemus]|uniref:Phospholipid phosphatase-related protein type 1-like isoform X2 n=1 Tax=Limulus polyphemus TaxID=6850 RepID=A0ABM1S0F6_LIMPO|nr:phospholipid phosphatase-related protein type 1-like isoform X2 [Limulus polyphemus]
MHEKSLNEMDSTQRSQVCQGSNTPSTVNENYRCPPKENILQPVSVHSDSESSGDEKQNPKVNISLIPVFILETISLGSLAVLAYFLRFEDIFPVVIRGFIINDPKLMYPKDPDYENSTIPVNFSDNTLYATSLAIPLGLILLGEIGYFMFSRKSRKVVRLGCKGFKLHMVTRRILRFTGAFLFGLLSTSILTDGLKVATGRPKPYFIKACNVTEQFNNMYEFYYSSVCGTSEEDLREARLSFPSFYASLSAYSGVYVMIYAHCVLTVRSSTILRPLVIFSIISLFILCGASRIVLHRSHWEDVVAGWVLGGSVAAYIVNTSSMTLNLAIFKCISTLNCFHEYHQLRRECCSHKKRSNFFPLKRQRPLFYRYFRIPHVSYQYSQNQTLPNSDLNTNYSETTFQRTNSYPQDLNRPIDMRQVDERYD